MSAQMCTLVLTVSAVFGMMVAGQMVGNWQNLKEYASDPEVVSAEQTARQAVLQQRFNSCDEGLKTVQVKKQVTASNHYFFVFAYVPENCGGFGGVEVCSVMVTVSNGNPRAVPFSASCIASPNGMAK